MSKKITESCGNVFIDLGYSPEESAILQMRADVTANLRKFIKAKRLTPAKAAEIFGVSQSRVSDLIRGKWEKFSLEMLITLATRSGMRVTVKAPAQMKKELFEELFESVRQGGAILRNERKPSRAFRFPDLTVRKLTLNEHAREEFANALLNPPAPGGRLVAAAKRYRKRMKT